MFCPQKASKAHCGSYLCASYRSSTHLKSYILAFTKSNGSGILPNFHFQ